MTDNAKRTGAAIEAHYQFLLWLGPALEKFPKSYKRVGWVEPFAKPNNFRLAADCWVSAKRPQPNLRGYSFPAHAGNFGPSAEPHSRS
jgi:hypothetical protein